MAPNFRFPLEQSISACIHKNATSKSPIVIDYDALQNIPWDNAEYEAGLTKVSAMVAKNLKTERYGNINSTQFLALSASIARSNLAIHNRFNFKSNGIDFTPDLPQKPSPTLLLLSAIGRGILDFDDEFVDKGWLPLLENLAAVHQSWESFEQKVKDSKGYRRIALDDVTNFTPVPERTAAAVRRRTDSMDEELKSLSKRYRFTSDSLPVSLSSATSRLHGKGKKLLFIESPSDRRETLKIRLPLKSLLSTVQVDLMPELKSAFDSDSEFDDDV
ncbi:hypothetical protein BT96DRAFT_941581 [Gymnopus androsaceus JB14]|uniref:Uncharacterized protein n=1 Tax=Gymnopus androsaceus JB14 TaxID=1447944 RepID=A0A6A4HFQ9_9AGAR|nr:hypothetical protein BT96DRAFT_941581 [Gymnopus androsaceus JB14]